MQEGTGIMIFKSPEAGPAAGSGSGDIFREAVAVDIRRRDAHPAAKTAVVRHELIHQVQARTVEDAYVRPAALAGPGHDVRQSIAVHIAGRDIHTARESGVGSVEVADQEP